jgi:hypothetical protein
VAKKTKSERFKEWAEKLSPDNRLACARETLEGALKVAHFLITLHETNQIVLYSDTLSHQVKPSHAAKAYNNFTRALLEIELVRLCSLWDQAGRNTSASELS